MKNTQLRTLKIIALQTNDFIDNDAATVLLAAIESNSRLTSFSMEFNLSYDYGDEGSQETKDEIAGSVGKLIRNNKTLQSFRLHSPEIASATAEEISNSLAINNSLQTLDLFGDLDKKSFSKIITGCNSGCAVENLYLSAMHNPGFPFPVNDVAEMIRLNTRIRSLGLCYFSLDESISWGDEDFELLLPAVLSNHTLIDLGLLVTGSSIYHSQMQEIFQGNRDFSLIEHTEHRGRGRGLDLREIGSKVRANAEVQKLRLPATAALDLLAPCMPRELNDILIDELTFRNEEQAEKSGTVAVRSLARIVGMD